MPILPRNTFGKLSKGTAYTRRNGENVEADAYEIARIVRWSESQEADTATPGVTAGSWEQLYRACDAFDPHRIYIAVLDCAPELTPEDWEALAAVGWHLIIDFDQRTDEVGGFSKASHALARRRSLRITALDDAITPVSAESSIWVAATGLQSRPSTIQTRTWREWNQTKARVLARVISELAQRTEPQPATVVVLGGEQPYVESVCTMVDQSFGERVIFIFATPQVATYSAIIAKFNATEVLIRLTEVSRGLRDIQKLPSAGIDIELPKLDGGTVVVPPERARWVEEDLELVHLGAGSSASDPETELRSFLRGLPISWYGLHVRVDVDRALTSELEPHLRSELASRGTRRANLRHWPGAGGSTLARRVAWNLHKAYPTVVAKRVQLPSTADRIRFLFSLTRLPVLVAVEAGSARQDDMDRLYDQLKSANVSAVSCR